MSDTLSRQQRWLNAKAAEKAAEAERRAVEDEMLAEFEFDQRQEGTVKHEVNGFTVKIVGRMNRKVDTDTLQDLARDNGLEQYLTSLFRWSADMSVSAWKATAREITDKLAPAITTTPGRPSFSIEVIMDDKEKKE